MKKQQQKIKYAISACLLGIPCRYNGKPCINKQALDLYLKGSAIPVCPEIMAGLPTPRPASEIKGGEGGDVLNGNAKIIDVTENDFTQDFINGSYLGLELIKFHDIKKCYLKAKSPSCGISSIYDGSFSGNLKKGSGVFAALLKLNNVELEEL